MKEEQKEPHTHYFEMSKIVEEIEYIENVQNIVRVAYSVCIKCGKIKRNYV